MGLVTGNFSRIGWKKLELAGLKQFFRFGSFAEQAEERSSLVRIAMEKARQHGWIVEHKRIWLIGDHPNDVAAAHANGIRVLAVATGLVSRSELEASRPDLVLDHLRDFHPEMLFPA